MAAEYAGSVEQVHRAFRDERYWLERLAGSGADEATLDSMTANGDGGIDVITTQTLRSDRLPAVVGQFHHGDLSFVREETWSAIAGGRAIARVSGAIPGAPATLVSSAVLMPSDGGSRLELKVTVEVRIPLVGGKVETFIGNQLANLVAAEQRFTSAWIRENA